MNILIVETFRERKNEMSSKIYTKYCKFYFCYVSHLGATFNKIYNYDIGIKC